MIVVVSWGSIIAIVAIVVIVVIVGCHWRARCCWSRNYSSVIIIHNIKLIQKGGRGNGDSP